MNEVSQELIDCFRTPSYPGSFFLSFEGIEGSGKSTQIVSIQNHLEDEGFRVIALREPGGTPFGEKLRSAILNSQSDIHPLAEAYLFASSRTQLLQDVILKELSEPKSIIICDRYIDSSAAYQGGARGLGIDHILRIHSTFPLNLLPHRSFYLRVSHQTSLQRRQMRHSPQDYFEARDADFHTSLIESYDYVASLFPKRLKIIDGEQSPDKVLKDILREIEPLFSESPNHAVY